MISLLTALLFSLAPALQASRISLVTALKEGSSAASDGPGRHHLRNLLVVAEGVETAEELAVVRSAGCDLVQGFFYSPALSPAEVEARLIDAPALLDVS